MSCPKPRTEAVTGVQARQHSASREQRDALNSRESDKVGAGLLQRAANSLLCRAMVFDCQLRHVSSCVAGMLGTLQEQQAHVNSWKSKQEWTHRAL